MHRDLHCPLCGAGSGPFHQDHKRRYLRCERCFLVFVPPEFHLPAEAEKAEYDLHENRIDDPRYRAFLGRLATPLLALLTPGSRGLEFGCGPGPALAAMLREAGHQLALYDPFYYPDVCVLQPGYDFITATEVVEHLHQPGVELERLWGLLAPGGLLGVMTKLVTDPEAFAGWHYKNDVTHVCFFSRETWTWWGRGRGAEPGFEAADVILLRKPCEHRPLPLNPPAAG